MSTTSPLPYLDWNTWQTLAKWIEKEEADRFDRWKLQLTARRVDPHQVGTDADPFAEHLSPTGEIRAQMALLKKGTVSDSRVLDSWPTWQQLFADVEHFEGNAVQNGTRMWARPTRKLVRMAMDFRAAYRATAVQRAAPLRDHTTSLREQEAPIDHEPQPRPGTALLDTLATTPQADGIATQPHEARAPLPGRPDRPGTDGPPDREGRRAPGPPAGGRDGRAGEHPGGASGQGRELAQPSRRGDQGTPDAPAGYRTAGPADLNAEGLAAALGAITVPDGLQLNAHTVVKDGARLRGTLLARLRYATGADLAATEAHARELLAALKATPTTSVPSKA